MEEIEMSEPNKKFEAIKRLRSLRNMGIATGEKIYSFRIETSKQTLKSNPEIFYEKMKIKTWREKQSDVFYTRFEAQNWINLEGSVKI